MVIIIDHDQVAQLQVTSGTGSFACDTLHGAPITKKAVCVVVDKVVAWFVEDGSSVGLSNGKTNCIGEPLPKWASGDFDAIGVVAFRMSRCDAVNMLPNIKSARTTTELIVAEAYSEIFQVIHANLVAKQMQHGILKHTAMPVPGKVESVSNIDKEYHRPG